jgi:peptidoglycan/LPS O-acetylase OafA/YrhL
MKRADLLKRFGFIISENFRFDINFLRAFSIISVVTYHYAQKLMPSGFIGVDVFFVISGYLISLDIFKKIKKNEFSLLSFYDRRARRILPALLFFLSISSLLVYFSFYRFELRSYAAVQLSSIFFLTNYYLIEISSHYFSNNFLPLKHLWSLSIEEQFYILFPIICIFIFRKKFFFIGLLTLILISFLLNLFYPSQNFYYNTLYRFHELVIGSIAAYFKINNFFNYKNHYCRIFVACGFLVLLISLYIFKGNNYNFFSTLVPCIGAFLIILFNKKNFIFNKYLSNFIFQFIGLISYSLYLYHYFFLIFFSVLQDNYMMPNYYVRFFLLIVSILFSYFSYLFVEKKLRY